MKYLEQKLLILSSLSLYTVLLFGKSMLLSLFKKKFFFLFTSLSSQHFCKFLLLVLLNFNYYLSFSLLHIFVSIFSGNGLKVLEDASSFGGGQSLSSFSVNQSASFVHPAYKQRRSGVSSAIKIHSAAVKVCEPSSETCKTSTNAG